MLTPIFSPAMAQDLISSDSDSDAPPSKPTQSSTKAPRRSRDDLSGNEQLPNRTRGAAQRQPSSKQAQKGVSTSTS